MICTPRVPVAKQSGFRFHNPYSKWFLDLEALLFDHLDP